MAQFDEIYNPDTGQTMVEYNGQWIEKPEGYQNPTEMAADTSPLKAGFIMGGKAIADLGRGVESLYYKATGDQEAEQELAREYMAEGRYTNALEQEHPVASGIGYSAPGVAAAFIPGGLAVQAGIQGTLGAMTYDMNSSFDNGVTDAMLTIAGYTANNAATRVFKLIATPMMQSTVKGVAKYSNRAANLSKTMQANATRASSNATIRNNIALNKMKDAGKSGFLSVGIEAANQMKEPLTKALTTHSLPANLSGLAANMFANPDAGYGEQSLFGDSPNEPRPLPPLTMPDAQTPELLKDMSFEQLPDTNVDLSLFPRR